MAGIYIHIPFCRKACHYCNFHFSTSLKLVNDVTDAILQEIELQKDYLEGEKVNSIYFGGGTPSVLSVENLEAIIEKINKFHSVATDAEITIEANPDDLKVNYIADLAASSVNRLSIGIQSFDDQELEFYNRSHTASQAFDAIENSRKAGFENISVDLIYGSPLLSMEKWKKHLNIIADLKIPHLSCYSLTVEPSTALAHFIKKGKVNAPDDAVAAEHFKIALDILGKAGYEQYEISNFCLPPNYAMHNSSYWKDEKYLGLGPAAHSYDKYSRQWNVSNNIKYIKAIKEGIVPAETETLTKEQRLNEYLMTGLRTKWGCDLNKIKSDFGADILVSVENSASPYISAGDIISDQDKYILSDRGKLIADRIISDLFI